MAERNAVKPRLCRGCDTEFKCTAKEIRERYQSCLGGMGTLVLPDCGQNRQVLAIAQTLIEEILTEEVKRNP